MTKEVPDPIFLGSHDFLIVNKFQTNSSAQEVIETFACVNAIKVSHIIVFFIYVYKKKNLYFSSKLCKLYSYSCFFALVKLQ